MRVEDGTTNVKEPAEKWQTELQEDDSNAPITAFILRGLKPESYYQVEVKARNDIDWSLANSEFVFKTSPGRWQWLSVHGMGPGTTVHGEIRILNTQMASGHLVAATACVASGSNPNI